MRKLSFAIALSLVLVFAFAGMSMAAQVVSVQNSIYPTGDVTYTATPKVFNPDGKANYPYEIYLPNENNPENYRIHSNYTKNTDACAACHATHTAVGSSLLQWYTVYDTCMACHDGTVTTTYDVQDGNIGTSGKATFGGHFGNGAEGSLSNHNVTGAMEIAAAPGGSTVGEAITKANGEAGTRWTVEFGCESCHSPHGQGGNARILSPDPNFAATKNVKTNVALTQIDSVTYAAYPNGDTAKTPLTWIQGYPYSKTQAVYVGGTKQTTGYTVYNGLGYTLIQFTSAPGAAVTADFYPSVKVAMTITNYLKGTESITHKSGMNAFCGACHTDYNTENWDGSGAVNGSGGVETGTYSKAHRHQVGFYYGYGSNPAKLAAASMILENGNMECLTCHVAHGTSADYWTRTVGSTATIDGRLTAAYITDDANLVELAGSSALKRLPNMGTCEACHAKGTGNEGYSANTSQANVTGTVAVANTFNFNSLSFVAFTGNASGLYGAASSVSAATYYSQFLNSDGSGFFANEKYVGSAKCSSCHKEYYDGWNEAGHSKSFQTAANFGYAAKLAAAVGVKTINLASPVTVNNVGGTPGTKLSGTPTVVNSFSYEITADGRVIFDAYKKEGDGTYTWNGQVKYDINNPSYIFMEHYVLFDIDTNPLVTEVANPVAGSTVAATPQTYARSIAFEGTVIEPYIGYGAVLPTLPSTVSWYGATSNVTDTAKLAQGCLSCHSPKQKLAQGAPDITIGCESCHGPASRHVAAPSSTNIFAPATAKLTQDQQVNLCQTCHSGKHYAIDNTNSAAAYGFKSSKHFVNAGMTCTTCHDVHNTLKGDGQHSALVVSNTNKNQLCASCHDTVINVETYMNSADHYSTTDSVFKNHAFKKALK